MCFGTPVADPVLCSGMPCHTVRDFALVANVHECNRDVKVLVKSPEVVARMPGRGADAKPMTPHDLADDGDSEIAKRGRLPTASGARAKQPDASTVTMLVWV